jgi:hypothetical protein
MSNIHCVTMTRTELEQTIVEYSRYLWGNNSTEFVVGLLSSIATEQQLEALVGHLRTQIKQTAGGK